MQRVWSFVGLLPLLLAGCDKKEVAQGAPGSVSAPASAAKPSSPGVPAGALTAEGCLAEPRMLLPWMKFETGNDLVRAIAVDGDQVFFSTMDHVFRMPIAGGAHEKIAKAPGTNLSGRQVLWADGGRLLTQSTGEPIFMELPKNGDAWKTFLDFTAAKRGGGREAATRILQDMGGRPPTAGRAVFDGHGFYWAEIRRGRGRNAKSSAALYSAALAGGEPKKLFETAGELSGVARAGDRLVFLHTAPAPAGEKKATDKQGKISFAARGERHLMSIPIAGGEATKVARFGAVTAFSAEMLLTDGSTVYASGYADEDLMKPGLYRIDAGGGAAPEKLDSRTLLGGGFVYGDRVVFAGTGTVAENGRQNGNVVLTGPKQGRLVQHACIAGNESLHALAIAGKTLLLSLFKGKEELAAIVKLDLP